MKTLISIISLSLASFVVSGCSESHAADSHDHAAEPTPACSYKEGMGLELSQRGAKFIGLQIAEFDGKLPKEALLRTAKGDFVFVQNGDRYLRTPVKVAATGNSTFELMEGLYEGDTIVVQGTRGLWLAELQAINGGVGCADGH